MKNEKICIKLSDELFQSTFDLVSDTIKKTYLKKLDSNSIDMAIIDAMAKNMAIAIYSLSDSQISNCPLIVDRLKSFIMDSISEIDDKLQGLE